MYTWNTGVFWFLPPLKGTIENTINDAASTLVYLTGPFYLSSLLRGFVMSVRFSGVFVVPGSEKSGAMHDRTQNNPAAKVKNVAIVAPTRSNSLDYLNFEEKRQLIASSLSLSDFLSVGKEAKEIKQIKETGVTAVIVGKFVALTIQKISETPHWKKYVHKL